MAALTELTAVELLDQLRRRACSSEEAVRAMCAVIRRRDPAIGGYLEVDEEAALAQAREADAARARGENASLLGLPIAVKDILNIAGRPCTCGSRILAGYRAPTDAGAITRLRKEGAVFLGRTNMDEFAMGSTTENSAYQVTHNPWNPDRVPGGSSGGSAAVVAAGEAWAALGTDTGGSIRQPAAFCGCVGIKPSYGRVSRSGLVAYASSLDQIGPMTRDVRDAALLLGAISGPDPMDSTALDLPVPDYTAALATDLKGMRIGLPKEYFVGGSDADVDRAVQEAIAVCRKLGAEAVEVSLPHTHLAVPTYYIIATAEASANLARFDGVRYGFRTAADVHDPIEMYAKTRAEGFGAEVKRRIILGTYVLSSGYHDAYYLRAQKIRSLIRDDFDRAFKACDVIVAPVTPTAAFPLGAAAADPLQMYLGDIFTVPVNLAGLCGLSVPCGMTTDQLPVGLQIIGPAFGEERVFRAGYAYEQATEWRHQRPPVADRAELQQGRP
jgi:aspartyl-tRNA(Asn)/glutamyl-tRNA(Gln) amidotransferase subunit A